MKSKRLIRTIAIALSLVSLPIAEGLFDSNLFFDRLVIQKAEAAVSTGSWIDSQGIKFFIYDDNTAKVAGGNFNNKTPGSTITAKDLVIPKSINVDGTDYPVTEVLANAFINSSSIESVTLPSSITYKNDVFSYCTNLKTINFEEGFTAIPNIFRNCTALTSVTIPEGVTSVTGFSGCANLSEVNLPDSLETIEGNAFYKCKSLTSIKIPSSLKELKSSAFEYSGITSIDLPEGLKTIGNVAFGHCENLANIVIPSTVTDINGNGLFGYCTSLKSVKIKANNYNLKNTSQMFFYCSSLTDVDLGTPVISDRLPSVFYNCSSLKYLDMSKWVFSNGVSFNSTFGLCNSLEARKITNEISKVSSSDLTVTLYDNTGSNVVGLYWVKSKTDFTDYANQVGTGWTLMSGSPISRVESNSSYKCDKLLGTNSVDSPVLTSSISTAQNREPNVEVSIN